MSPRQTTHFVGAAIEVGHDTPPAVAKRPGPPDEIVWQDQRLRVVAVLREWHDYRPRGSTKSFYVKERGSYRALAAQRRGSFGVGRDYYRLRLSSGEVFDVYYDRSPRAGQGGRGGWYLWRIVDDASA
jgi:hypothetical protein